MFKLEFSTENAAFGDNDQETRAHEVQLILLRISAKLAHGDTFGVAVAILLENTVIAILHELFD